MLAAMPWSTVSIRASLQQSSEGSDVSSSKLLAAFDEVAALPVTQEVPMGAMRLDEKVGKILTIRDYYFCLEILGVETK